MLEQMKRQERCMSGRGNEEGGSARASSDRAGPIPRDPQLSTPLEGRGQLRLCKDGQCSCGYIFTADGEAYIAEVLSLQELGPDPVCGEALRKAYQRLFQEAPRLLAVAEWIVANGRLGPRGWSGRMPLAQWRAVQALVQPFGHPDQSADAVGDAAQVSQPIREEP